MPQSRKLEQANPGPQVSPSNGGATVWKCQAPSVGPHAPLLGPAGLGIEPPPFALTPENERHITVGDPGKTRTGHLYTSLANGKTKFPKEWDRNQAIAAVRATIDEFLVSSLPSSRRMKTDLVERDKAIVANSYLMLYPSIGEPNEAANEWLDTIWSHLQHLPAESITGQGRRYGGGLKRIEP